MHKKPKRLRTAIAFACVACAVVAGLFVFGAQASESYVSEIRGVRVDLHLATEQQRRTVMPSLAKQIGVAMSLDAPPSLLEFFRTVLIVVDPNMLTMATNGQYMQGENSPYVRIKPIALPEERAIVLHELMHAYHHQILKMDTPDIRAAFSRAQREGVYPDEYRRAAFMTNTREYFANMATIFLLGKSERPPYSCENILKAQPKFVGYLTSLFGPHPCS
jgi:hypothetical protein